MSESSAEAVLDRPGRAELPDTAALEVVDARTHNLKGVSCSIPHGKVTVVTGPSGAGKSSLVFDTLFAEGQRRFVESMSTYAQQFIQQLERPPVGEIRNLLPAVALEARNSVKNARSTVGTLTEIHDLLRLLFSHLGTVGCPEGHGAIRERSREELVDDLVEGEAGERFTLTAPVVRPETGADDALEELIRQGFFRVWIDGELVRLEPGAAWKKSWDPLEIVLGRYRADPEKRTRIRDALEEGFHLREDLVIARSEGGETRFLSTDLRCPLCGEGVRRPVPPLFSFNSPLGACPTCSGFGRVMGIDGRLVIPDPGLSLEEKPIAPWNSKSRRRYYTRLRKACRERGVPLDVPWEELPEEDREWIWEGGRGFKGIQPFFDRLERKKYKMHVRVLLSRYRSYDRCPDCGGARLQPEALAVTLRGETLPELTARSVEALREWVGERGWTGEERARAGDVLDLLEERLETLHRVGVDYLTLDRTARTLSGGETQRIHLATALGSGLTGTLYALDEPTIGLHPRDAKKLLGLLRELGDRGNTVVVVEHEPVVIEGAEHVIELGPGAGEQGGERVFEGSVAEMLDSGTLTARFMNGSGSELARRHAARYRRESGASSAGEELARKPPVLEVLGASEHNLREIDVAIPGEALVAVTGVSGSGKSTLIEDVLFEGYREWAGEVAPAPGRFREIRGLEGFDEVEMVDQSPLGRSSRSNPITYVKGYGALRKLFARTPVAEELGFTPGHFSFNVDKGRCPACKGTGEEEVDLQFLGEITVICDRCQGRRFRPEILQVRLKGKTIAEALDLTVTEALELYGDYRPLERRLEDLDRVGLGYIRLGQPTSTLSAGEAQRLKLAGFLKKRRKKSAGRLFLFDEPTTGLHLSDIALLYKAFRELIRRGDTVVVVEHQLDLISRCDWIVDLGPGGGHRGGDLLFSGPREQFLAAEIESPTREELRAHLGM
ncbi:MAG: excinuclease ABC subunit UvrA [Thermoanaerobaculia bacterium]|nr:excinuclease ABC subunit UvrA [Thermoanaerobaculia bacterium]